MSGGACLGVGPKARCALTWVAPDRHMMPRVRLAADPSDFKHALATFCAPDLVLDDPGASSSCPLSSCLVDVARTAAYGLTSGRALLLNPAKGTSLVRR